MAREAQFFQGPDTVPVEIKFVPFEAVTGRNRMGVVIVVPAFSKGHDRHPPAVRGKIAGDKPA